MFVCGGTGVGVDEKRDRHEGAEVVVHAMRVHMPMAPGVVREQVLQPSNHVLHWASLSGFAGVGAAGVEGGMGATGGVKRESAASCALSCSICARSARIWVCMSAVEVVCADAATGSTSKSKATPADAKRVRDVVI